MQVVTQLPLSSEECCPFTVLGSLAWVLPQLYIPLWLLTSQVQREKSVAGLPPDIQSVAQGWGRGARKEMALINLLYFPPRSPGGGQCRPGGHCDLGLLQPAGQQCQEGSGTYPEV